MNKIYDIVIIGGGPAGLALAQCCSSIGKKVVVIDKEDSIGGCHRVRRVNGLFTEHGPRVYSSTYNVFISLLEEMNTNFFDIFTEYNFSISRIGGETIWSTLDLSEMFILFIEFVFLLFDDNHGKDTTMQDLVIDKNFKIESISLIDRLCRLTDGAGIDKYTLHEFLQLFNQQAFHKLYQPKLPNDIGLFKIWKSFLDKRDVDFILNSNVEELSIDANNKIQFVKLDDNKYIYGKEFVVATPPISLINILKNSNPVIKNCFGNFNILEKWAKDTAYIEYLSITFHWDTNLELPKVYGFPKTSWGVAFIVLSDYMKMSSGTVISAAVTIIDKKSRTLNKTADECSEQELVQEVFNQLRESFPNIPSATHSLLSPGVVKNKDKWISKDTAFIASSNEINIPFKSSTITNIYNLGTHNGYQRYHFTSLESAVTNALELSHVLYPELKDKYKISRAISVKDVIFLSTVIILIIIVFYGFTKYRQFRKKNR